MSHFPYRLVGAVVAVFIATPSAHAQTQEPIAAEPVAPVLAGQEPLAAEQSQAIADLSASLRPGQRTEVVTRDGRTVIGRLSRVSASGLVLLDAAGQPVELGSPSIFEVIRRGDPISNGVGIGATCGLLGSLVVSLVLLSALTEGDDRAAFPVFMAVFVGGSTAAGAGAGALVDAAIEKRVVVFRAQARGVSVMPILAQRQQGVALVWGF